MSSRPSVAPAAAHQTPEPAQYTSHFADIGGLRLHYLDYGTRGKPAMLCVHGSAAHGHWFDFIAPGFTPDYHVRALDLRGHGDSDPVDPPAYFYSDYAADLDRFVRALDLRDLVLVGHSMGGTISLVYSATYPGRVGKLIVVDSTVNLPKDRIKQMRDIGSRPGRDYDSKEAMVERYGLRPGNSLATPEVVRYIASRSVKQTPQGLWRYKFDRGVYATREMFDGRRYWNDVKVPVLLVRGGCSHRITAEVYEDVKARCPQAELVTVAASDHHVTLDNPRGFIDAVKPWLEKTG
jgi:pimeloyl-ACP methyl ester carboxylesterase